MRLALVTPYHTITRLQVVCIKASMSTAVSWYKDNNPMYNGCNKGNVPKQSFFEREQSDGNKRVQGRIVRSVLIFLLLSLCNILFFSFTSPSPNPSQRTSLSQKRTIQKETLLTSSTCTFTDHPQIVARPRLSQHVFNTHHHRNNASRRLEPIHPRALDDDRRSVERHRSFAALQEEEQ